MTIVYSAAVKRAAMLLALCGLCAGQTGRCTAAIIETPIPTPFAQPQGITSGPDGAYWFTEYSGNRIGRIDTNGVVTEYGIPTPGSRPYDIVNAGDGSNLWFTEATTSQIGRIGTNGVIQEFRFPFTCTPTGITMGPDHRLWVADFGQTAMPGQQNNGGVISVALSNAVVAQVNYYFSNMTYNSRPVSITSGPDGNLYFTEQNAGNIGRITTNGVISEATVPPQNTQPLDIAVGPDGAIWFTQFVTNALGRIDPSNFTNVMQFSLPANNTSGAIPDQPNGIVLGQDGNLYYADPPAGIIGQVSINGTNFTVNQYYTPTTNAQPWRIAAGPDGDIWFGEFAANNIGKFEMPVPLSIQLTNGGVVISWSTNVGTNFVLEENTGFNPTNWMLVTNVPVANTNTGLYVVDIAPTNAPPTNSPPTNSFFFRLID